MATSAEVRAGVVAHLERFVPPAGSPAWKRYAEPAAMLRRAKSLTNGAWALDWRTVSPVDRVTRPKTLARAEWLVLVTYQLSPAAAAGKTTEEQLLTEYLDALRLHLFTGPLGAHDSRETTHTWDGEAVEAAVLDGWVLASLRGISTFYLDME